MVFTDQIGHTITLSAPPQKIVSLVPSQTELLYTLGLDAEVVGITKFCVHPSTWFRSKTRVGGTKNVHPDIIRQLSPDLIIANKEENLQSDVTALMAEFPVWVSNIQSLADACDMITRVGDITGRAAAAHTLANTIQARFAALTPLPAPIPTAYFIWRNPWMVAGGDTFIHEMMQHCGLQNVFGEQLRYPVISPEQLAASGCRLVLLSSEPYPFREKHLAELQEILPEATIRLVDGEMFSWYGSRLLEAPDYFRTVLTP
ncbi:helical backbone metal receptor [Chitinophaga nivalis]|uniref:Helical backbone metal receptor n=1 Tax=Chitinophaga nivalis TaxID=2991709 RepID=A0ABT3IMC2_9BACT|nr:helical backbone metal receptor [Chitinophaga nivalis]MCW3465378.1 helical backbone metal receptor [Chitinophaga nivalis]MCW3484930.1 helical backbone metal receptor [Chitinophaga nivalis]